MSTTEQVMKYLSTCDMSRSGRPDAARALGTNDCALGRRLRAEGVQYSNLVKQEKIRRCVALLSVDPDAGGNRLTAACGYADKSSFFRAFREWFGVNFKQYAR